MEKHQDEAQTLPSLSTGLLSVHRWGDRVFHLPPNLRNWLFSIKAGQHVHNRRRLHRDAALMLFP